MAIYVNDRLVDFGQYPNGEAVVPREVFRRRDGELWPPTVRLHWEDDSDLVKLKLVRGHLETLKEHSVAYNGPADMSLRVKTMTTATRGEPRLVIDYMPYSRMDRAQDGHCFSLKYVAEMINAMRWDSVQVVEPHSDQTLHELRPSNPTAVNATTTLLPKVMERVNFDVTTDFLVLPDKGALDRYAEQARDVFDVCHLVVMRKARDFATGKIQGLEVDHTVTRGAGVVAQGMVARKALIVDDLSSRGGTFVGAAEILRDELDFAQVYLLVTHMEQVGLEGDLTKKLDQVFCTNTLLPSTGYTLPNNFTVFPRSDWL